MNARLDELQAAFLRCKLKYLDRWNAERVNIANKYFQDVNNPLIIMPKQSDSIYGHIYHVFAIRCCFRDELENYLNSRGINTVKHYPIPMHLQEAYKDLGFKKDNFPIAEEISNTILSLPLYYGMPVEYVDYVIECLNDFKHVK